MKIAVASGKGGTGKTMIAVSLALSLSRSELGDVLVSDCDVEAPNAHLFLKTDFIDNRTVNLFVPQVNNEVCSGCGACGDVCQFNAVIVVGDKPTLFPSLCHGCGSCMLNCPEGAIQEVPYAIGRLESGACQESLNLKHGLLNPGEPLAVPVIADLRHWDPENGIGSDLEIIDAPPGASCPVVEAVRGTDFIILVTEPTPFGLHDLKQAVQVTRELGINAGVVNNRVGVGDQDIRAYCQENNIPLLMEIPLDQKLGEGLARGKTLLDIYPAYCEDFNKLFKDILVIQGEVS